MRLFAAILFLGCSLSNGMASIPEGYELPKETVSPDGKYGVLVPSRQIYDPGKCQNVLVDATTGTVIVGIISLSASPHGNHSGIAARWSRDSSTLAWIAEGKWGPVGIVIIELKDGTLARQTDLLKAIHARILGRLKEAHPQLYTNAREANRGNGSAFPDGFTVDVHVDPPDAGHRVSFAAALSSDPKCLNPEARVEASLEGEVAPGGSIKFNAFHAYTPKDIAQQQERHQAALEACDRAYQTLSKKLSGPRREALEKEQQDWKSKFDEDPQKARFSFSGMGELVSETKLYENRTKELRDK